MVDCCCKTTGGTKCTRATSQKPGHNQKFCWQHQTCQIQTFCSSTQTKKSKEA